MLLEHHEYRRSCLNMIASEIVSSPSLRRFRTCDFGYRYVTYVDDPLKRRYPGGKYIGQMEAEARRLAAEIFEGKYVDFRPLGGQMAGYGPIFALTRPGDVVIETGMHGGGEKITTSLVGTDIAEEVELEIHDDTPALLRGLLKVRYWPFDYSTYNIDVDAATKLIRKEKPRLIIIGRSLVLFPEPVRELAEVAKDVGAYVLYDACHYSLFVIAKRFPNPLKEGADILSESTTKTLPGPQGGMFVTNDEEIHRKIGRTLYPAFVANDHYDRIPAILVMLLELKEFGQALADQIVRNSKALGKAMDDLGFKVFGRGAGFSETHMIICDFSEFGNSGKVKELLERANILASERVGTGEISRIGMKERHMSEIAQFFRRALIDKETPERVAKDVTNFVSGFDKLEFSVDAGARPYAPLF
jgi:glycine hydroxymethyltransferase